MSAVIAHFEESALSIEDHTAPYDWAHYSFFQANPTKPLIGTLPNGTTFRWGLLNEEAIPDMLELQDAVSAAATEDEKKFLIKRTRGDLGESMVGHDHLYWGAWVGEKLIAFFGLGEKDEEISDGRGEPAPLEALGVTNDNQVDILKAAQTHPDYRDFNIAKLAAATRYQYFLNDPKKKVMMTKIHQDNGKVIKNYTKNGFTEACRSQVTDPDDNTTFDVITYKADRALIEAYMLKEGRGIAETFKLYPDPTLSKVWKSMNIIQPSLN